MRLTTSGEWLTAGKTAIVMLSYLDNRLNSSNFIINQ